MVDHTELLKQLDALPAACQHALDAQTLRLVGEPLSMTAFAEVNAHLESCAGCRARIAQMATAVRAVHAAFPTARATPDFAARTLAALPAAQAPQLRVYATAQNPSAWKWVRVAALVALIAGGILTIASIAASKPVLAVSIQKGKLVDDKGAAITSIRADRVLHAQEDTLLRGKHDELLNLRKGARFKLQNNAASTPEVHLEDGDLYASATLSNPVRMGCANFDAELSNGECYLAQETSAIPQSVMILFDGNASIHPNQREPRDPIGLRGGQIYYSVGLAEDAYTDTLELVDYTEGRIPEAAKVDPSDMRRRYERQVEGYRAELSALNARIAQLPAADPAVTDLRDRCVRIQNYLRAHETRLQTLPKGNHPVTLPLDCIERGLKEHHDPKTWM